MNYETAPADAAAVTLKRTATEELPNKRRKDEDDAGDHAKTTNVTTNTRTGAVEEAQVEQRQAQKQQQAVTPDDASAFTPAEASLETLGDHPSAKLRRDDGYSDVTEDLLYGTARYALQANSCLLLTLGLLFASVLFGKKFASCTRSKGNLEY